MDYEEDMRPEKKIIPNYFYEWSEFTTDDHFTEQNIYHEHIDKKNMIKLEYSSDVEYLSEPMIY